MTTLRRYAIAVVLPLVMTRLAMSSLLEFHYVCIAGQACSFTEHQEFLTYAFREQFGLNWIGFGVAHLVGAFPATPFQHLVSWGPYLLTLGLIAIFWFALAGWLLRLSRGERIRENRISATAFTTLAVFFALLSLAILFNIAFRETTPAAAIAPLLLAGACLCEAGFAEVFQLRAFPIVVALILTTHYGWIDSVARLEQVERSGVDFAVDRTWLTPPTSTEKLLEWHFPVPWGASAIEMARSNIGSPDWLPFRLFIAFVFWHAVVSWIARGRTRTQARKALLVLRTTTACISAAYLLKLTVFPLLPLEDRSLSWTVSFILLFWASNNAVGDTGPAMASRVPTSRLKAALAVTAGLALAFLTDPWISMRTRLAELEAEARSRQISRSVLVGTPAPGNAWEEYGLALKGVRQFKDELEIWTPEHGRFLQHLLNGAKRTDVKLSIHGANPLLLLESARKGLNPYGPQFAQMLMLHEFVAFQARELAGMGRTSEATNLLLAMLTLERDIEANGGDDYAVDYVHGGPTHPLRDFLVSNKLTPGEAAALESKLATMNRETPPLAPTLADWTWSVGWTLLADYENLIEWHGGHSRQWRLFPAKEATQAFEVFDTAVKRLAAREKLGLSEVEKELDAIRTEMETRPPNGTDAGFLSDGYFSGSQTPGFPTLVQQRRYNLTLLRLAEMAAHYRATGAMETLPDPFGAQLFNAEDQSNVRIWSVGPDRKNDKGVEDWEWYTNVRGTDIVLKMPK